jgi:hypothetical protein
MICANKTPHSRDGLPKEFINRFGQHVTGFLSGFDRVVSEPRCAPYFVPMGQRYT